MSSRPRPPNFGLQNKIKHYLTRLPFLILGIPVFHRMYSTRVTPLIREVPSDGRCSSSVAVLFGEEVTREEGAPSSVGRASFSYGGYAISLRLFIRFWCYLKIT